MKKLRCVSSCLVLAAGVMAALLALPQSASAQLLGGFVRPGAAASPPQANPPQANPPQANPVQPPERMRPGPIVRGTVPIYRSAPEPVRRTTVSNGPIFGRGPVQTLPVQSQQPNAGRGGNHNYGDNNNYGNDNYGNGPVVIIPDGAYYPSGGSTYGETTLPPIGPANGFFRNPIPPVGPANGYFTHPIPPVGPANGFFSGQSPITGGGPPRLGGYYYGNYCDIAAAVNSYPSVYSTYDGFPQYIDSPNVVIVGSPYAPVYATPFLPFFTPVYQTIYNQNNYYVATEGRVAQLQEGGAQAKDALGHAYLANSFQAAFADIAHAWTDGNIDLVRRHLRDPDTRISVFLDGTYSYSIASSDFSQITRDALDRLHTVSFDFTRLRKAKNGDVTAYGTHIYRVADSADAGSPNDQPGDSALGAEKTVSVSYTLRHFAGEWDVIATDSADHDLAKAATNAAE
jgi:hypothetical protein